LEAHQLGGFSGSFSSRSICRFCHIQYNDLDQHIHDYDGDESHKRWQISEYDSIAGAFEPLPSVNTIESDDPPQEISEDDADYASYSDDSETEEFPEEPDEDWGVKHSCPLNVLKSFHCVNGLPPDLLHDLLEGVVAEDLLSVIRALAKKGWLTIDLYNKKLKNFWMEILRNQ